MAMTRRRGRGGGDTGCVPHLLPLLLFVAAFCCRGASGAMGGGGGGGGMGGFDLSAGDSYIRTLTKDDFEDHIGGSTTTTGGTTTTTTMTTVVAFLVPWCGHCKRLIPRLELVGHAFEKEARVTLAKVDCDAQPELKAAFNIGAFPTLLAFEHGSMQAVDKYQGDWTPLDVLAWVNRVAGTGAAFRRGRVTGPAHHPHSS